MAYIVDQTQGDIVIAGFQNGIGSSPYSGLTDMRCVNPTSVPGEASVAFATKPVYSQTPYYGVTISAYNANLLIGSGLNNLESWQAVYFTGSTISGLQNDTIYWIYGYSSTTFSITTNYGGGHASPTLGLTGTATMFTYNMILGARSASSPPTTFIKNYEVESSYMVSTTGAGHGPFHFILDSAGLVWSDIVLTGVTNSWTYMGNITDGTSFGNGMVYLQTAHASSQQFDGWIFIWRNSSIDYLQVQANGVNIASNALIWVYGWNPYLNNTVNATNYLTNPQANIISHEAIVTPNNIVVFCDTYVMGQFFQETLTKTFNPLDNTTYSSGPYSAVLSVNDCAQSLSYLNNQILIGGTLNRVYQWDAVSFTNSPAAYIFLPENNTSNIISVGQNAYIFCGNRGRIYITNGSQASFFAKVPDHISGSVQPIFLWGGACYNLNQLYFGIQCVDQNTLATNPNYGGIWGIDLDTQAIYISNELSYGYNGLVSVVFPMTLDDGFRGYGLYAGWNNFTNGTSGVDVTINTPYIGGQSYIVSEMIPVGTALDPTTSLQIEFKLAMPLLLDESVQILMASSFYDYVNNLFTDVGTITGTAGPYTTPDGANPLILSGNLPATVQRQQWILIKVILTSISTNPSYNRLTELRIIGGTVKDNVSAMPYATK